MRAPVSRAMLLAKAALIPALLLPSVAQASDEEANSPIIVTGTGLGAAPAVPAYSSREIDRETITSSASGRIEDVLANVAGFQQFRRSDSRYSNPSAQGVTLRALGGNAAARTQVLLDGVPMADPMFGSVPWNAITPERLGSIRVTRGGGSGAFGSGAVAGTIELNSAGRDAMGLFSGEALANDRGETTVSGALAPKLGAGFAQVYGRWDRGDGFWTTPESQRVGASVKSRYDSWSVGARGVAPIANNVELQARVMAFDDHRTLRFAGAVSHSSGEDFSLRLVGRGKWQFDALAYIQDRGFSNVTVSATTFRPSLDQRRTPATGLGAKVEIRPPVGPDHLLRIGSDWRSAKGDLNEIAYNAATGAVTAYRWAGGRNDDLGFYAEDDWKLGPLTLTGGVRADRWSVNAGYFRQANATGTITINNAYAPRSDWAVTGRGGALLKVAPGLELRGSAYTGLRQPTINELYRSFTLVASGVSTVTNANAALGNEMMEGYEAGVDFTPVPALKLSATAFYNRVAHAIANVTTAQTATTITRVRQNVDAIRARGLEFAAALDLGRISLDGSLALTDAVVRASGAQAGLNGMRPAQTPKIAASATVTWKPRDGWQGALVLRHFGSQYEDDLQTYLMPSATTIGAFVQAPLGHGVSFVLRGENLANVTVITRNQAGSMDIGAPRTVWAGLRFGLK